MTHNSTPLRPASTSPVRTSLAPATLDAQAAPRSATYSILWLFMGAALGVLTAWVAGTLDSESRAQAGAAAVQPEGVVEVGEIVFGPACAERPESPIPCP